MGIYVTADTKNTPLSDAANEAIHAVSFPLSDGNYRDLLSQLFLDPTDEHQEAIKLESECEFFLDHYDGHENLSDERQWELGVVRKLLKLTEVAKSFGADRIIAD